ncbi:helix-turn-helix domain-containing protein [Tichowtungia aerotolerans]|nr:helix-turn-helix domain-containing protein [Tichowtungia aerotolerans]
MLCDLRAELEIFAVRQICKKNDRAWVEAQFTPILKRLLKATKEHDSAAFTKEDQVLHKTIIELANLPVLKSIWETVWETLARFHRESFSKYWPDLRILMREHEYLINTICSCDLSAAEDGVRNHLQAIWFRIAQKEDETQLQTSPLSRAVSYISFNLQHPLILNQIAGEIAFTSAGHLSKLFKDRYGKSFQSYVQEMRLDKAATLLQQTDLPISTIAHRVGYQDISRFGQHFKRRFEKTPNQWRQHTREKTG